MWPENALAFEMFSTDMSTGWVHGMGGPTGLDYSLLPVFFSARGVKKKKWMGIIRAIKIMEHEALRVMAEAEKQKRSK